MKIIFPEYSFRIKKKGDQSLIFDPIRKKFVALTPEEWVRQHWIQYLVQEMKYPRSLIASEFFLKVNERKRRSDIVVFDQAVRPWMLIECKAPEVSLTQKVAEQAAVYNLNLKVPYLVISNGKITYGCEMDYEKKSWSLINHLPVFDRPTEK